MATDERILYLTNVSRYPKEDVAAANKPYKQVCGEEWNKLVAVVSADNVKIQAIGNASDNALSAQKSAKAAETYAKEIRQQIASLEGSDTSDPAIIAKIADVKAKLAQLESEISPKPFRSDEKESSDITLCYNANKGISSIHFNTRPSAGHRYVLTYFYRFGDVFELQVEDYDVSAGTSVKIVNSRYRFNERVGIGMNGATNVGTILAYDTSYAGGVSSRGETLDRFPYADEASFTEMESIHTISQRISSIESDIRIIEQDISTAKDLAISAKNASNTAIESVTSGEIRHFQSFVGTLNSGGANYDTSNENYSVYYIEVQAGHKYSVSAVCTTSATMYSEVAAITLISSESKVERKPVVLQPQGTTETYNIDIVVPDGYDNLLICQKVVGSNDTYSVKEIITTQQLQDQINLIKEQSSIGDLVMYTIKESKASTNNGVLNWVGDPYGDGMPDFAYNKYYGYDLVKGNSYRIKVKFTAPSVSYPDRIASVSFRNANGVNTPLQIIRAGNTQAYDFIYEPAEDGRIFVCQDTRPLSGNYESVTKKPNEGKQAIIENNALPYFGKKWFACGDSYTMLGDYFKYVEKSTGMKLIGSTEGKGNGQPLTYMCHLLHVDYSSVVRQAEVITIVGGTNDVGSMQDETTGDFETSVAASMSVINQGEGEVKRQITTIYGAVKSIVAAIRDLNKDCLIVFCTQPERSLFTINTNDFSINPSWGYLPNKTPGGLNMQIVADAMTDCCKRLGVPCYDFHANAWDYSQNCNDSAEVVSAIKSKISSGLSPKSFLNTIYSNGETYAQAFINRALTRKYTSDGLHPNEAGSERLGRQLGKFINTL